ncbi:MAG: YvrJ family protein [Firmicutes bacterium HGW-Firmicutes-15]|nr:MAG: YvrJ family protein [Firmicutes bacterium HGW-Firmicutes-15]
MDEMIKLIANVGFPIAVAVFLLVRVESRVTILTQAITELREAILVMPREQPQVVYPPARTPVRDGL